MRRKSERGVEMRDHWREMDGGEGCCHEGKGLMSEPRGKDIEKKKGARKKGRRRKDGERKTLAIERESNEEERG